MQGGTPHRRGDDRTAEDRTWDEVRHYAYFAVKHNWTPEQVDRLPDFYAQRLPQYHEMLDEIHDEQRQRSERIAKAHGN